MSKASRLARRIRLYGPPSRLEKFLTWKNGPVSTECLAYSLIIVLVYINVQMILAIYAEKANIENTPNLHIDLGLNPIAAHEAGVVVNHEVPEAGVQEPVPVVPAGVEAVKKSVDNVEGVPVIKGLCPSNTKCPANHIHIYAESGARKSKICLNGKEVLPAWKAGRGLNLVVINPQRASAGSVHNFDTYGSNGVDLVDTLAEVNEGRIVVVVAQDEASSSLGGEAKQSLERIGSTLIHQLGWRNTYALVGQIGLSSISPYEVKKEPMIGKDKGSQWAEPVALSACIPHNIDSQEVMQQAREEFCATYDNYGDFCSTKWVRPTPPTIRLPPIGIQWPIAIIAGNRGAYLRQSLTSLFKVPGINPRNIIVFQDGYGEETFEVVRQFGVRLGRFPKTVSNGHKEDTFNHADHIAFHYKRSLDALWYTHKEADYALILEDDLTVGPDIIDYFSQLVPVLEADKTLFIASAWNDNGYAHASVDPTMIYRTEFFPGLGWLLPKKRWDEFLEKEWPPCCNGHSWDLYLRLHLLIDKGLDCLYPDISRTFHIGKVGANVGAAMFNAYFRKHAITTEEHYNLANLDKLGPQSYSDMIGGEIATGRVVDHTADPCEQSFITQGTETLVMYYYQRDYRDSNQATGIIGCFHLFNMEARGLYNTVIRVHFRGNKVYIVGMLSKYAKASMPEGLTPYRIALYSDERKKLKEEEEARKLVEKEAREKKANS